MSSPDADEMGSAFNSKRNRRDFLKRAGGSTGLIGIGAVASGVLGRIWNAMARYGPESVASVIPTTAPGAGYPQFASWLIWRDNNNAFPPSGNFQARCLSNTILQVASPVTYYTPGTDYFPNANPAVVVNSAIATLNFNTIPLQQGQGGIILLTDDVNDPGGADVIIDRAPVVLASLNKISPQNFDGPNGGSPRPHLQRVKFTCPTPADGLRGGALRGLHLNEVEFDGTGDQRYMILEDCSFAVYGATVGKRGLRFMGSGGNIKFLTFHNTDFKLRDDSPVAAYFENFNASNAGSFVFSGRTNIDVTGNAGGVTGNPVGFQFHEGTTGNEWVNSDSIVIENLAIRDGSSRPSGTSIKPFWMEGAGTNASRGVRSMNIGNFYFEPKITPSDVFKIDAQGVGGAIWFGVTVNDLFVNIGSGLTVNILNNQNTRWQSDAENFLRISAGRKVGAGTLQAGTLNLGKFFRLYLRKMPGFSESQIGQPWIDAGNDPAGDPRRFVGFGGNSQNPPTGSANMPFIVIGSDLYIAGQGGANGSGQPASFLISAPDGQPMQTVQTPFFVRLSPGQIVTPQFTAVPATQVWPAFVS